ncbi:hypothetical protein HK414_09120 [Ramlibacter terrae]|uniref:Uncharacterized protein n=1 Tax=Ramlibacter terrae TaxID=2732511 RepID=A0ABX6NZD7_9BURK|nr:hypothetical protein HK414_09120 [Ramlibacter terrae]
MNAPNPSLDFQNSRGSAGFTVHSPHDAGASFLQRGVAVVVLLTGAATFVATVIWPLVNILR